MRNCKQMTRSVSDAMDRQLDAEQSEVLVRHLAVCTACRRFHDQLVTIRLGMRKLQPTCRSSNVSSPDDSCDVQACPALNL